MANFRAINMTCGAVMRLLEQNYDATLFNNTNMDFKVVGIDDFKSPPIKNGVSLFVYRVLLNDSFRIPPGRVTPSGKRQRAKLPLDVLFLLSVWAEEVTMQLSLLGWMMRTLEDYPILNTAVLNTPTSQTFQDDEQVELIIGEISNEDLLRIWDAIPADYQLSVPYVARVLRIESNLLQDDSGAVLTRDMRFGTVES